MKVQVLFTIEAEAAAQRYGLLVEAWRALYANMLSNPNFGSPKASADIWARAYEIANSYIEGERQAIANSFEGIVREALRATGAELGLAVASEMTDAISAHADDVRGYLLHELLVQIERDILFLKSTLGRMALQVSLAARASGKTTRAALLTYQVGNQADMQFLFHDRRGNKWPSQRFVRAVTRHALITIYNETVLQVLADHGLSTAVISHLSAQADANGMKVSLLPGSSLPVYGEIRNEVFHPNSDAIITRGIG
jgi:hypothetical protein